MFTLFDSPIDGKLNNLIVSELKKNIKKTKADTYGLSNPSGSISNRQNLNTVSGKDRGCLIRNDLAEGDLIRG